MPRFVRITRQEMETVLGDGWQPVTLPGVRELVWGKRIDREGIPLSLRVFSSIDPSGQGRDCGKDAIRVELATRLPDGTVKRVGGSKRVNRVPGWQARLRERIDRWESLLGPGCPRCGCPTVSRKGKRGRFWGCVRFPECRGTAGNL